MNETEYLEQRVEDQIKWYGKKSARNKKWFRICQFAQLLMAALITLSGMTEITNDESVRIAVPIIGALIAIITGIVGLYKFQENWLEYRTTAESLKHEKFLFMTKSVPYDTKEPLNKFVNEVESIISKENTNWSQYMRKALKDKKLPES